MRANKKAQMTIVGIIMVFILVIIVSVLMPTITDQIETAKNNTPTMSTGTSAIMDLIPLMIVLGIIITIFIVAVPYRPVE